jgi:general stress protein CsbA
MLREVNDLRTRSRWISVILVALLLAAAAGLLIMAGGCEKST